MTDVEVRDMTDADVPEVVQLISTTMGPKRRFPFTERYWRWKHHENPFGRSPCLVATAPDGRIVAVRAFMRWEWQLGDQVVPAVRAVDTAVHPDWQGRGLFTRLTRQLLQRMADEPTQFVFNTPNDKSLPGYLKMGWQTVGKPWLWARPGRLRAALPRALRTKPDSGQDLGSPTAIPSHPAVRELLGARACSPQLRTRQSLDFLSWRYGANPSAPYRLHADGDGEHAAAAIARVGVRRGVTELLICELLVGRSLASARVAARLVRDLLLESGAAYALCATGSQPMRALALLRTKFVPAPGCGPRLVLNPLKPSARALLDLSRWGLTIGDLELF